CIPVGFHRFPHNKQEKNFSEPNFWIRSIYSSISYSEDYDAAEFAQKSSFPDAFLNAAKFARLISKNPLRIIPKEICFQQSQIHSIVQLSIIFYQYIIEWFFR